jgi:hypothetical protein
MQVSISIHREAVGLMLTNLRVGDRVEDKKTHKRGRVTFVYSEPEFKDEVIEVLFDGRESPVGAPCRKVMRAAGQRATAAQ